MRMLIQQVKQPMQAQLLVSGIWFVVNVQR